MCGSSCTHKTHASKPGTALRALPSFLCADGASDGEEAAE